MCVSAEVWRARWRVGSTLQTADVQLGSNDGAAVKASKGYAKEH